MSDVRKIERALLSVSNKSELEKLARFLYGHKVELISTGGTGKFLENLDIPYTPISKVTGNPEAFNGRMKTLSFEISSSLLFRRGDSQDEDEAKKLNISPIDLVVCNLYPFEEVIKDKGIFLKENELVENIDIGGPTMIRASAKNYDAVTVLTSPNQYDDFINHMDEANGGVSYEKRKTYSLDAFRHTARYDFMIASTMEQREEIKKRTFHFDPKDSIELRYGENPHQQASIYKNPFENGLAQVVPIQGKALSHNNFLDADASIKCTHDIISLKNDDFKSVCTIVKHLNPCGCAMAKTPLMALKMAWEGDPISSFGGILCFSDEVNLECAKWLQDKFVELIIAPSFSKEALNTFSKKKNLRLLPIDPLKTSFDNSAIRSISGGWLVQSEDQGLDESLNVVSKKLFEKEKEPLIHFSIMVTKHLRSNAIGLVRTIDTGFQLIGGGMGNPNRVISLIESINKAKENGITDFSDCVLASDAFFPFADSIEIAKNENIKYIVEPGGSIRDNEVIKACDDNKIALIFTGRRHFRH